MVKKNTTAAISHTLRHFSLKSEVLLHFDLHVYCGQQSFSYSATGLSRSIFAINLTQQKCRSTERELLE